MSIHFILNMVFYIGIKYKGERNMRNKLMLLLFSSFLLTACSESADNVENEQREETSIEATDEESVNNSELVNEEIEFTPEENGELQESQLPEIIDENALGGGDELISSSLNDGVVEVTVKIKPHELLEFKDLASMFYSNLSDELLKYTGWETLIVNYEGTDQSVSFNVNEAEENEWNAKYFPTIEIENRIK